MNISSVARAGLVAETRRSDAVQDITAQTNSETAGVAQAVQQRAAASADAQYTRAPEKAAAMKFADVLNDVGNADQEDSAGASADAAATLQKSVLFQNNATLQEQIAERVRLNYELV